MNTSHFHFKLDLCFYHLRHLYLSLTNRFSNEKQHETWLLCSVNIFSGEMKIMMMSSVLCVTQMTLVMMSKTCSSTVI